MTWLDDHVSKYDIEWLLKRHFSDDNRKSYLEHRYRPTPKLWSKNQFEMKMFQANDVFEDDEGLISISIYAFICLLVYLLPNILIIDLRILS